MSYHILHSLHTPVVLVVGKFTSRGWAFYYALAFLHYVAIALHPGANRTIGIPSFVGPLGHVMQPSNGGQHILLQECPNSLRHYFLWTFVYFFFSFKLNSLRDGLTFAHTLFPSRTQRLL
jgi:hypothetical protein